MKLHNIEINGTIYAIKIGYIFDTNNNFKATLLVDGYDPTSKENTKTQGTLHGVHHDYSALEMEVKFVCYAVYGEWAFITADRVDFP